MPRKPRERISGQYGSMHIISRTAGDAIWLDHHEIEYLKNLLHRFASGFFIQIHTYCIMNNHFHILASCLEEESKRATPEELLFRYQSIFGKDAQPPEGSRNKDNVLTPDADGGIERLRERLGSVSRFVQEFKQTFSSWYNKRHHRKGCLWGERFKSVVMDKGEARLICSAYIDLNPVRAGIVNRPEDYRWSGMGLFVRQPAKASRILQSIFESGTDLPEFDNLAQANRKIRLAWYREFVYLAGGVQRSGQKGIPEQIVHNAVRCHGRTAIGSALRYRTRNISEGMAIGSYPFIAGIQRKCKRKFIRPRVFLAGNRIYATRVLHSYSSVP